MRINLSDPKIAFNDDNITDSQKNPIYKEVKNELMNI